MAVNAFRMLRLYKMVRLVARSAVLLAKQRRKGNTFEECECVKVLQERFCLRFFEGLGFLGNIC